MYLTTKQHDDLRTLVTNVEVPYRAYIANEILKQYDCFDDFNIAFQTKQSTNISGIDSNTYSSCLGQMKSTASHTYDILKNTVNSIGKSIIMEDIDIPYISQLNVLLIAFQELFQPLLFRFGDISDLWQQAYRYSYVRNKLSHPGCKTLEKTDLNIVLDFISNVCSCINDYEDNYFYSRPYEEIEKQISLLQSQQNPIPLQIHNIYDMPFPDAHVVCRDNEIKSIKDFVYGKPGALRKKSTYCLFGYGGVGKTALVLESIKSIIQDIQDEVTVNNYKADFILFFTAKDAFLDISVTSGKIESKSSNKTFSNADELVDSIYTSLGIDSFDDYKKTGIIVVDNLESLSDEDRNKVRDFLCFQTPSSIQFIITSRNEEDYDERKKLAGFEDEKSGKQFISEYIEENNLDIILDDDEQKTLLDICKGNTLVLVLSLRRLSYKLDNINNIVADMTHIPNVNKISSEFASLPSNGYDIISDFMYKNTFGEIEKIFSANAESIYALLKIFAVYSYETIDISTLCMLTNESWSSIETILSMLCKYLIIEKRNGLYSLNQFAAKYIIQRFLPDAESYNTLSVQIEKSTREIKRELNEMQKDIARSREMKKIMQDWYIVTDGDKIAAARAFSLYRQVKRDCISGSRFHINYSSSEALEKIDAIEKNTMHPYIKFQKARIIWMIESSGYGTSITEEKILNAYNEVIWVIKTNPIYESIKHTKSYASVQWFYGLRLLHTDKLNNVILAIKYLEDAKKTFEQLDIRDKEYYKCVVQLGFAYVRLYEFDRTKYISYLRRSRTISIDLYKNRNLYDKSVKQQSIALKSKLLKYGQF